MSKRQQIGPRGEGPKNIIMEKLHFDKAQAEAYQLLIDDHRKKITTLESQLMDLKNKLYSNLKDDKNSLNTDSLMSKINVVQLDIEKVHYHHFQDIKNLCKPDQKPLFDKLTEEIAILFSPMPMKKKQ
jgi:hypothetical protein